MQAPTSQLGEREVGQAYCSQPVVCCRPRHKVGYARGAHIIGHVERAER